uniref:60S ribosomal protein L4 n=1 Tax=Romanomermis culicivorax TaxID=13658 RepID=A0A915HLX7_ROMCU
MIKLNPYAAVLKRAAIVRQLKLAADGKSKRVIRKEAAAKIAAAKQSTATKKPVAASTKSASAKPKAAVKAK